MTERVIFIDIDGVLLPTRMWAAAENIRLVNAKVPDRAPLLRFDPGSIGLIVRLCRQSGARLVLASNWRRTWTFGEEALRLKLVAEGLSAELWHDEWMLPVTKRGKWHELADWIEGRGIDEALIIDDEPFAGRDLSAASVAQVIPDTDEGFGMMEYRAAGGFFGIDVSGSAGGRSATLHAVPTQQPASSPPALPNNDLAAMVAAARDQLASEPEPKREMPPVLGPMRRI